MSSTNNIYQTRCSGEASPSPTGQASIRPERFPKKYEHSVVTAHTASTINGRYHDTVVPAQRKPMSVQIVSKGRHNDSTMPKLHHLVIRDIQPGSWLVCLKGQRVERFKKIHWPAVAFNMRKNKKWMWSPTDETCEGYTPTERQSSASHNYNIKRQNPKCQCLCP